MSVAALIERQLAAKNAGLETLKATTQQVTCQLFCMFNIENVKRNRTREAGYRAFQYLQTAAGSPNIEGRPGIIKRRHKLADGRAGSRRGKTEIAKGRPEQAGWGCLHE